MAKKLTTEPDLPELQRREELRGLGASPVTVLYFDKVPCPRCGTLNRNPFDGLPPIKKDVQMTKRCRASNCRYDILYRYTYREDTDGEKGTVTAMIAPSPKIPRKMPSYRR